MQVMAVYDGEGEEDITGTAIGGQLVGLVTELRGMGEPATEIEEACMQACAPEWVPLLAEDAELRGVVLSLSCMKLDGVGTGLDV